MVRVYEKPSIMFEEYELNTAIASGCKQVVSMGPGIPGTSYRVCDEYDPNPFAIRPNSNSPIFTPFYGTTPDKGGCSCELSSTGGALFTS